MRQTARVGIRFEMNERSGAAWDVAAAFVGGTLTIGRRRCDVELPGEPATAPVGAARDSWHGRRLGPERMESGYDGQ